MTQDEFEKKFVNKIIRGDNMEVMPIFPDNCVDTIITDPQYGLKFMGKEWDYIIPGISCWQEVLRIAKPGAMMLCFGGTRTSHRLACAIEDAGWQIRDTLMWLYGSGFPKSLDISKAIDKGKGARKPIGTGFVTAGDYGGRNLKSPNRNHKDIAPATDLAKLWDGWGTALKPAYEDIIVAMKPLDGTFAHNAETWGVAGLNIDESRIKYQSDYDKSQATPQGKCTSKEIAAIGAEPDAGRQLERVGFERPEQKGRWPANVILDPESAALLDEQSGNVAGGRNQTQATSIFGSTPKDRTQIKRTCDSGGVSRFFYCAKASRAERNAGLEGTKQKEVAKNTGVAHHVAPLGRETKYQNNHPTVKPLKLMEYLCKLTKTPTGGIVLDCFGGSGTTAMACINTERKFILIEKNKGYCEIAEKRVAWAQKQRAGQKGFWE